MQGACNGAAMSEDKNSLVDDLEELAFGESANFNNLRPLRRGQFKVRSLNYKIFQNDVGKKRRGLAKRVKKHV